ncbi:unnamed protein product [Trichogramma brassicae]|uniref:Uncharacterized protein n=1 Tax=Trichogramma brassicae TaxID=86971 RepID=A0A6H5J2X2_9HYME|nr:unnamed protein product [Trichogramma brassicae]
MGYRDEPDFDKEGNPILRRTTPLHLLARGELRTSTIDHTIAYGLFEIYNKFDLNYIDEFGLTHFHVACKYGCKDVVQQFLDLGQVGPNLLVREIDDSPLLLALNWQHKEVAKLLLRRGADSNLPNRNGLTPLHVTCQTNDDGGLMQFFFNINDELNKLVQVNVRDKFGNTPLNFAIFYGYEKKIELLLRRGADSNLRNAEGSTALHIICHRSNNYDLAKLFFEINKELDRSVQLDVADNYGRTPLQLAVFYLRLDMVDFLINNGADLSNFVFPADIYFGEEVKPPKNEIRADFELRLASSALLIVERLEKWIQNGPKRLHDDHEIDRQTRIVREIGESGKTKKDRDER